MMTTDNVTIPVTQQEAVGWEWFKPLFYSRWSNLTTHGVSLHSSQLESWLYFVRGVRQHYGTISAAVDYFLPESDDWLLGVDLSEVQDDTRLGLRERVGRVLRRRGVQPYTKLPIALGVHCHYALWLDPAYDSEYYASAPTQQELERALELTELSVLTSVLNDAYLLSLKDGSHSNEHEIPWYHVDYRDVVALKRPNLLRSSLCVRGGVKLDRNSVLKFLVQEQDYYLMTQGENVSRVTILNRDQQSYDTPSYTEMVLGTTGNVEVGGLQAPEVKFVAENHSRSLRWYALREGVARPLELYARVMNAMLMRSETSFEERLVATRLYPLTNYDGSYKRRTEPSYLATMREAVATINAPLIYTEIRKMKPLRWPLGVRVSDFRHIVKYGLETIGSEPLRDIANFMVQYHDHSGDKKALAFAHTALEMLPDHQIPPTKLP